MNRQDTTTRRVTTAIVLGVGLFAGADSYTHVFSLARSHGQDILSAAFLPLAGDGVIAAASAVMLVASRQPGGGVPLRARVMLIAGIAATVAANIAYGYPHGLTDALLSVWPVACYVGATEALMWLRAHTGMQVKRAASASPVASVPVPAVASVAASPVASDELAGRRGRRVTADLGTILAAAEKRYPEACKGGKPPPLRTIQTELAVGQPNAQKVQAHFRALCPTALVS